ncbi:hypothetical protein PybrP1_011601 [[Pythium] brassicae (nom. inval.)]|nr:hypothetical protein PybrP1_011601 [[Pythium] brassicae (nom. inval.)]
MRTLKRVTGAQAIRIARRLLVVGAIIVYIVVSFQAAIRSYMLGRVLTGPLTIFNTSTAALINDYVGTATVREGRLVKQVLAGDTTPRESTLYLESLSTSTFTGCSGANFDTKLYGNAYLREMYAQLIARASYKFTRLSELELVLPVVDCSFGPVVDGDNTHARVFYVLRRVDQPAAVFVLTASMAIQNYAIPMQHEQGACLVATLSLISDMRASTVQHYFAVALGYPYDAPPLFEIYELLGETSDNKWVLQSLPRDPSQEQTKVLETATSRGIYLHDATIQSNIRHMIWPLDAAPTAVLGVWRWQGRTVLRDNWAWVHYIHAIFGLSTLFSLATLFLVMFRNFRKGKVWIGDAFAQVSSTLVFRGTVVVVSCHFNEYWAVTELSFDSAFTIAELPPMFVVREIAHADFLTLFLCCADFIGYASKTRIDPAFVVLVFEVVLYTHTRLYSLILPGPVVAYLRAYCATIYRLGVATVDPILAQLAPLRLWSASPIPRSNVLFLTATSVIVFAASFCWVVGYVVVKKAWQRQRPGAFAQVSVALSSTHGHARVSSDGSEAEGAEPKRAFTHFELATGAELQNRFGVMCEYDNFVYFKGLRFASADGIYCNGFVIANGKFLLATEDLLAIVAMKLLRTRLRNVYTYEVDGSKLKQTAQLVYPDTLSWKDLLHPNVDILT